MRGWPLIELSVSTQILYLMVLFYIILSLGHVFKPGCDYKSWLAGFCLLFLFLFLISTKTQHSAKGRRKLWTLARSMELNGSSSFQTWNCSPWPRFTVVCDALVAILKCWSSSPIKTNLRITSFGQPSWTTLRIISHFPLCAPLCFGCALIVHTTSSVTPYYLFKCSFSLFEYETLWRGSVLLVFHWPRRITGLIICWMVNKHKSLGLGHL